MDLPLRLRVAVAVALAVAGLAPAIGWAAARRSLAVELAPAGDWRVAALVQALTADLADDQLTARALPACGGPCTDSALRSAGVELILRATLIAGREAALAYELRALWPGARAPLRGSIGLRGLDRVALAGALRDQLHRLARATSDDTGAAAPDVSDASGASGASAGLDGVQRPPELSRGAGAGELQGGDFLLVRLDLVFDRDPFRGARAPLQRPELLEIYPFEHHLHAFVDGFRRRYLAQRGRL